MKYIFVEPSHKRDGTTCEVVQTIPQGEGNPPALLLRFEDGKTAHAHDWNLQKMHKSNKKEK